jgi:hypothetical protein
MPRIDLKRGGCKFGDMQNLDISGKINNMFFDFDPQGLSANRKTRTGGERNRLLMNSRISTRDEIIFGTPMDWLSDNLPNRCLRFDSLNVDEILKLVDLQFLTLDQKRNGSPSILELIKFSKAVLLNLLFEGFASSPYLKESVSVVIEALYYEGNYYPEHGLDFADFTSRYHPNEITIEHSLLRAAWN